MDENIDSRPVHLFQIECVPVLTAGGKRQLGYRREAVEQTQ